MGHKWVPVFAPDVIGLTTGQPLNTVTHNRDRDRKDGKVQRKTRLAEK